MGMLHMYRELPCVDGWLAGWLVFAWYQVYIYIYLILYHSLKGDFVVKR